MEESIPISEIEALQPREGYVLLVQTKASLTPDGWLIPPTHHILRNPHMAREVLGEEQVVHSINWIIEFQLG